MTVLEMATANNLNYCHNQNMERERKGGLLLAIFKMPALSGLTFVISVFSVKEIISSFSL